LAFDQFINEKLLVDVVGCAARIWKGGKRSTREAESELVPRTVIAHVVSRFMEPGGEYSSVHCKAQELEAVARTAMAEQQKANSTSGNMVKKWILHFSFLENAIFIFLPFFFPDWVSFLAIP
jgi:hypothetical protein